MTVGFILWVLFAHWIADFVCQTSWQAQNKSKNWNALFDHVIYYSIIVTFLIGITFTVDLSIKFSSIFWAVTFLAHFFTDAITSRITSYLYNKKDYHNFFVVIGFDQILHYTQLFLTLSWLNYGT